MQTLTDQCAWLTGTRTLGPAQVLEVDPAEDRVRLRLAGSDDDLGVWARVAMTGCHELARGDTALVIGEDPGDLYVIGLLNQRQGPTSSSKRLTLNSGAYAQAEGLQGEQTLQVFSRQNELLFEYDEANRRARVNVSSGDLEFVAQNGNIAFRSGQEIAIHGQAVRITSPAAIRLGITDAIGKICSALTLHPRGMKLSSPEVGILAERGDFAVDEAVYTGSSLLGKIGCAKLIADKLETMAESVFEKARNVYRTVEQLSQLKAGRVRTLVASTYFFRTRKAFIHSDEDYKIKAEKIHLG
jgi:hypothetical protein